MAFRNNGGTGARPTIFLPKDAILPYVGNRASIAILTDWTSYNEADNCYLYSATNNSEIGVITNEQLGSGTVNGTLSTDTHGSTSTVYQSIENIQTGSGGIKPADQLHTHTHTLGTASEITNAGSSTMLNTQQVILLRANKDTAYIPANSLLYAQSQPAEATKTVSNIYIISAVYKNNYYMFVNNTAGIIPGMVVAGLPTTILAAGTKVVSIADGNKVILSSYIRTTTGGLQASTYPLTFTYTPAIITNQYYTGSVNYYLKGGTSIVATTGKAYSLSKSGFTNAAAGHNHVDNTKYGRYISPWATGTFRKNYEIRANEYLGTHAHTTNATFSQSTIDSKLLKLWKTLRQAQPTSNIIVMYAGRIEDIPQPWYLCDGNNGTTNLGGYIIGFSGSTWNVTTTANPNMTLTVNTSTTAGHNHANWGAVASTSSANGPKNYHSGIGWSHTHTVTTNSITKTPYKPKTIGVAFIQYKG